MSLSALAAPDQPLPEISRHPRVFSRARPLIAEIGQRSGEFPDFLANHLPMVLEAMARLGASPERLTEYAEHYNSVHAVPYPPKAVAPIDPARWTECLGDRSREADYRDLFTDLVSRRGGARVIREAMPVLAEGVAASATHGLMRLAYAVLRRDESEVGIALGYWAATYLPLPRSGTQADIEDPALLVVMMQPVDAFRDISVDSTLLWRWIENMGTLPQFQQLLGRLKPGESVLGRMRQASLALYAATMSFEALHAVTGCHWLRLVAPHMDEPAVLSVRFWEVVLALYAKIGMPDLPSAEMMEDWRRTKVPSDGEIAAAAVVSDDEHDHSLVFSALEEFKLTGDPLYRVVAAKRVGLA